MPPNGYEGSLQSQEPAGSSGDVEHADGTTTDNAIAKYHGDGNPTVIIQNTGVIIDDANALTGCTGVEVTHSALVQGDAAVVVNTAENNKPDVRSLEINHTTGTAGRGSKGVLVTVEETLSSANSRFAALEVVTTKQGLQLTRGLKVGAAIAPLFQFSGTYGDANQILNKAVDVTAALADGGAGGVTVFVDDNDTLTVSAHEDAGPFDSIEFVVATPASTPVDMVMEYSTGVGTWASNSRGTDSTNGLQKTGVLSYVSNDFSPAWAKGAGARWLMRLTRLADTLVTKPVLTEVQIATGTDYGWDENGDVNIRQLCLADETEPANPGAGLGLLFKKLGDDGVWWKPDAGGAAVDLTDTGGGGGLTFTATKTANYTAAVGEHVLYDGGGGTFTVTLPASPSEGDKVGVMEVGGDFEADITVSAGSNTLVKDSGQVGTTMNFGGRRVSITWQFDAVNSIWRIIAHFISQF